MQRFTNAIARAQRWVAEHTDREVAEAICGQFPDTDLAVLERVCARHREIDAWNLTPVMEQAALERLETVMTTAGQLKQEEWVDFDRLVDNSFAQKGKLRASSAPRRRSMRAAHRRPSYYRSRRSRQ